MAIIQNGADISNLMLGTARIAKVYQGTLIVWAWEVVSVLSNGSSIVYANSLFPNHWDKPNPKRIVVPAGVERGGASALGAIAVMPQGSNPSDSFAGSLTIEIAGTVSGIGGTANSGVGGDAFFANFPGRDGQKMVVNNYGTIRAGGGGGGKGGTGGNGNYASAYTYTEGPVSEWIEYDSVYNAYWPGVGIVGTGSQPTTGFSTGGWYYYRGAFLYSSGKDPKYYYYQIYRNQTRYTYPTTYGGAGGNGGRGYGYDGANAGGAAGAGGGTNAGTGGTGGTGGGWGAAGNAGGTGGAGNVGGGAAGSAGGLAGYYLNGSANVTINNSGTIQGRII